MRTRCAAKLRAPCSAFPQGKAQGLRNPADPLHAPTAPARLAPLWTNRILSANTAAEFGSDQRKGVLRGAALRRLLSQAGQVERPCRLRARSKYPAAQEHARREPAAGTAQ